MSKNRLLKRFDKKIQKLIAEVSHEIELYNISKPIAGAMLELAELGFNFAGHGRGFGSYTCEDFSLRNNKFYVNFHVEDKKCIVSVSRYIDGSTSPVFTGPGSKAISYIKSLND